MALPMLYNPATGNMIVSNTKNLYIVDSRIKIATYEELIKIGVDDDYPIDADYLQIADITQPSTLASHVPIALKGTYDGGFFELKDFVITGQTGSLGVFSNVSSNSIVKTSLSNIIVNNMSITVDGNSYYAGCIAGYLGVWSEAENCLVINSSITGNVPSKYGGAFGYRRMNLKNIQVSSTTIYNTYDGYTWMGGIVGVKGSRQSGTYPQIENCISTNNTLTTSYSYQKYASGISAYDNQAQYDEVTNCFSATSIINAYAYHDFATIQDNYGHCTDDFYDKEVFAGGGTNNAGTGLTTLESKLVSSYPTWDISYKADGLDTKFRIDISGIINDGYPYLTQFETALLNGGV